MTNYNIKLEDFTPFVGSFIYKHRNWKNRDRDQRMPEPYLRYFITGLGLTFFDAAIGLKAAEGIAKGIESLVK